MSSISYFSYKLVSNSSHIRRNYSMLILILNLLINCWITSTTAINSHVSSSNFPIYMVKSPESIIAPKGDEVQFECELNLEPEKLEWRFRPQNSAINRDSFIVVNKNSGYNVTKTGKLSQMRVYVNQKTVGDYECVAWFGASAITSTSAKLMLATIALNNTSDKNSQGPVIHYKIAPNNSLIVRCGEVISYPPPVWTYFKDNNPLPPNVLQVPSGGLILSQMKKSDSGTYSCLAVNSITGSEIKLPQRINIHVDYTPRTAPTFLTKPVRKFVTKPGETVVLECAGVGNPVPKPVWSRPDKKIDHRAVIHGYGLVIRDLKPEDQGPYHCRLDNGMINVQDNTVYLAVHEHPIIIDGPKDTLTNETDSLSLQCKAKGSPAPVIYWKINGQDTKWDPLIRSDGSKILIQSVEKRHAGIIQCFAKNEVGETSAANQLRVNPKQIIGQSESYGSRPLGILPHSGHTSNSNESIKPTKRRKKNKNSIMVPPTRPNVSRLSDESVMVRWSVPANDGLPIQFFKVQHRLLGDSAKKVGRSQWKTANEDIPPSVRSYLIDSLKPDHIYRFRIAAVYSNNDNKLSPTSDKFHLLRASQLGLTKSHLPPPNLTNIESLSETEIIIHWTFPNHPSQPVEGFYVYYRPSTTAGEYSKATVEGQSLRNFKIDNLEPGTSYECKIQSFTSATASEFSAILTGRTKKLPTPPPIVPSVVVAQDSLSLSSTSSMIVPITAGVFGIIILGIVFCVVIIAFKNRKLPTEDETENKTHPDHIQIEANGFAGGGRILNGGVLPRMNITNNPLAQDEKNRNIVELQCVPNSIPKVTADIDLSSLNDTTETTSNKTTNNNCCEPPLSSQSDNKIQATQQQQQSVATATTAVSPNLTAIITPPASATTLGIPSVPNHHYHNNNHHNNNHHNHHRPTSPSHNANRRTLERNNRNNNNKDSNMHQGQGQGSMRHHNNHQKHHNYNKSGQHQQNNQSSTYHYNSNKNYPKNTNHHHSKNNNNFHGNNNPSHNNGMIDECGLPIGKNVSMRHRRDSSSERVHNNRQQYNQQQHNPKRLNSIEV